MYISVVIYLDEKLNFYYQFSQKYPNQYKEYMSLQYYKPGPCSTFSHSMRIICKALS